MRRSNLDSRWRKVRGRIFKRITRIFQRVLQGIFHGSLINIYWWIFLPNFQSTLFKMFQCILWNIFQRTFQWSLFIFQRILWISQWILFFFWILLSKFERLLQSVLSKILINILEEILNSKIFTWILRWFLGIVQRFLGIVQRSLWIFQRTFQRALRIMTHFFITLTWRSFFMRKFLFIMNLHYWFWRMFLRCDWRIILLWIILWTFWDDHMNCFWWIVFIIIIFLILFLWTLFLYDFESE